MLLAHGGDDQIVLYVDSAPGRSAVGSFRTFLISELILLSGVKRKLDIETPKGGFWRTADIGLSARLSGFFGLMHRNKIRPIRHLVAAAGCAITGLIATAVSNRAGRQADVWSNADSWLAKPSQAVQYRRD